MFWLIQCHKQCSTRESAWSSPLYYLPKWLVQSNIAIIFADDTKLYRSIITPDNSSILKSDIDLLVEQCRVWQMKCNFVNYHLLAWILHPGSTHVIGSSTELHQISMINRENDLGITFTHDTKFTYIMYLQDSSESKQGFRHY